MNPLAAQRVWVIGAGFLGRTLRAVCRRHGADVLTLDVAAPADIGGDAADPLTLEQALRHGAPRYIYCCMATRGGTPEQYRQCYVQTVKSLLKYCPGARLIFCSSVSVYGDCGGAMLTENTPPQSAEARALILLEAEQLVLQAGGTVARLAALYSDERCALRQRHLAGAPCLPGAEDRMLHYVHVEDAAAALVLPALLLHGGIYNVCGSAFTKAEAYAALEAESGVPRSAESVPSSKRGMVVGCVSAQTLLELGWTPRSFFSRSES